MSEHCPETVPEWISAVMNNDTADRPSAEAVNAWVRETNASSVESFHQAQGTEVLLEVIELAIHGKDIAPAVADLDVPADDGIRTVILIESYICEHRYRTQRWSRRD